MLRSGKWDAQVVMNGMADKVLRSLPPAADSKLSLIGDTTHKSKRGKKHPLGHVTRQSKSSPHFFGFVMVVLVASCNGFRIPIKIATIDPERKGHQNILFRQMLRDFEAPSWVREIVVLGDAGYPANPTLKLIESVSKKCFGLDSTDHEMDHRHVDHRLTARREVLVVFAQPAVFAKPAEGALNDPPFWQEHEACRLIGAFDDLQANPAARTKPQPPRGQET